MLDLLLASTTPAPTDDGGGLDFFGIILWPLKWVVEVVLVGWHSLFTLVGMPAAAGLTWVLSIVGLVIIVRSAMIPLTVRQIKSQRKMMEIAPELKKVQEKYRGKKDQYSREAMSRETMALYKKHGTTPVSSCLPILVQMPVFFALFSVLNDVTRQAQAGRGGVGLLSPELTREFYEAQLFGVASLHERLADAWAAGNTVAIVILVVLVVLMIASQFFTQLQIISKNLSPEAKTGQAYQMQKVMLYILPLAFIFSGVFFPLGVVIYWFISNLWTMGQQFIVIRNLPTPGSEAAKAREERLARKGKAINAEGKVVPMEVWVAEQERLLREAEAKRAAAGGSGQRKQNPSKQRAKKQAQKSTPPSAGSQAAAASPDAGTDAQAEAAADTTGDAPAAGDAKPQGGNGQSSPVAKKRPSANKKKR